MIGSQWQNPSTLHVSLPAGIIPGVSDNVEVEGELYNEATFIS